MCEVAYYCTFVQRNGNARQTEIKSKSLPNWLPTIKYFGETRHVDMMEGIANYIAYVRNKCVK